MKNTAKLILGILILPVLTACSPDDLGPRASLGNANAPVVIEEFSDFQCPACAIIAKDLKPIILRNTDKVRLDYYHFPLPQHENAFLAAEASECAGDQGKFWEYGALLFENQERLTEDNLKTFAGNLQLDQTSFDLCLNDHQKKGKVKADFYEGQRRQVSYTPSLYVNGQLVRWEGAAPFEAYLKGLAK